MDADRYAFTVEWLDQQASLNRQFQLFYYHKPDGSNLIELIDIKNRKTFLKKCPYPSISIDDLYIGARVTIYARQMTIVDYEDDFTRKRFEKTAARCFALVYGPSVRDLGQIWSSISRDGMRIARLKMIDFSPSDAASLFPGSSFKGGLAVAMELIGENPYDRWARLAEVLRSSNGRGEGLWGAATGAAASTCLDRVFGSLEKAGAGVSTAVAFQESKGPRRKVKPTDGRVPSALKSTATMAGDVTCVVLKPHLIGSGRGGEALEHLWEEAERAGLRVTVSSRPGTRLARYLG